MAACSPAPYPLCHSMLTLKRRALFFVLMVPVAAMLNAAIAPSPAAGQSLPADEARAIAREAYIYGFPLVDNYRIQYSYFVDRANPEFKTSWNTLVNNARVYTPDDKTIQTPNSDTPYSFVGADLRAEPLVFTVPQVDKGRYYSLQFIDQYTFDFAYVGSRAIGNGAASYLLAGPNWKGTAPKGIPVIRSETQFVFVLYRTQLFDAADIENVKPVQAGYKVQTLSEFLGQPAPPAAPSNPPLTPRSVLLEPHAASVKLSAAARIRPSAASRRDRSARETIKNSAAASSMNAEAGINQVPRRTDQFNGKSNNPHMRNSSALSVPRIWKLRIAGVPWSVV